VSSGRTRWRQRGRESDAQGVGGAFEREGSGRAPPMLRAKYLDCWWSLRPTCVMARTARINKKSIRIDRTKKTSGKTK